MSVSFVGAADNNVAPVVCAADALLGILSLLAWAGSGVNMFPDTVDVSRFWKGDGTLNDAPERPGLFQVTAEEYGAFLKELGRASGYSFKGCSPATFKPYTSDIRNGYRANGSAQCPAVPVSWSRRSQVLLVRPMEFNPADLANMPAWVGSVINGRR